MGDNLSGSWETGSTMVCERCWLSRTGASFLATDTPIPPVGPCPSDRLGLWRLWPQMDASSESLRPPGECMDPLWTELHWGVWQSFLHTATTMVTRITARQMEIPTTTIMLPPKGAIPTCTGGMDGEDVGNPGDARDPIRVQSKRLANSKNRSAKRLKQEKGGDWPTQSSSEQTDCSFTMPVHRKPPTPEGNKHSRTRSLTPSPQLTLHRLHCCHGPQDSSEKQRSKTVNIILTDGTHHIFYFYLTCALVDHQTGFCRTRGATVVENKAEAVLMLSGVKHRTVKFRLILALSQPVKGEWWRRRLLWSKPQHSCSTCFHCRGNGNTSSNTCILIQQHFPIDVSTRWGYQFNSHSPLTAALVNIAVFHQ